MRKQRLAMVAAIVAISLSGCGTVCNLAGGAIHPDTEPRIYGGVLRDFETISEVMDGPAAKPDLARPGVDSGIDRFWSDSFSDDKGWLILVAGVSALGVVDPILSFAADTLTLPVTIPLQLRRDGVARTDRGGDIRSSTAPSAGGSPLEVEQLPAAPSSTAQETSADKASDATLGPPFIPE